MTHISGGILPPPLGGGIPLSQTGRQLRPLPPVDASAATWGADPLGPISTKIGRVEGAMAMT